MSEMERLPYKTINVFIEQTNLHNLLEEVLKGKDKLKKEDQIKFSKFFRHHVNILGFRNPTIAPFPLQVKAYLSAFEQKEEVIPFTLSTWVKIHQSFAEKVKYWLEGQGWTNLELERFFQESEGFSNKWPENTTVDGLVENFLKDNPKEKPSREDLILMIFWISGMLPEEEIQL